MSSGIAASSRGAAAPGLRSGQLATIALLLALAGVAWWVTDLQMSGMDAGPGTDPGAFGFYIGTWVVMMAAMMFPSIAPMVLMYRSLQLGLRRNGTATPVGATSLFVCGYLVIWGLTGLLGYTVLKAGRALDGGLFAWEDAGRWTAAAVLLIAAAYEFAPLKRRCLTKCRGPLAFLLGSWRAGRRGAFTMGLEHGGWCVGCCWALMAALFALGAMSITWMLLIAALIAVEKLLPWRSASTLAVAAVLAALALGMAVTPGSVPALTVPGKAMPAMGMSHGSGATHSAVGMSHRLRGMR